jgi:hypothetical protein
MDYNLRALIEQVGRKSGLPGSFSEVFLTHGTQGRSLSIHGQVSLGPCHPLPLIMMGMLSIAGAA